ncbi:MAG: ribonuclease PH [Planctomycetota bacterium]|nr:MAG: ribonuclease PH [Planctomycetota bacterium]
MPARLRDDGRRAGEMRPVRIKRNYTSNAPGSALIEMGNTTVLCTASVTARVPPFLYRTGRGWVTSEYGMLPGSTRERKPREERMGRVDGRTAEIQRLIGRSMRAAVDTTLLGERTIWIDCDVLQADGGTRTAAITGGFVALVDALRWMKKEQLIDTLPLLTKVAAVSVGMLDGRAMLDLTYGEDAGADVDMNVVMTGRGELIEIQGTAERRPFSEADLSKMLAAARRGIKQLMAIQARVLRLRSVE